MIQPKAKNINTEFETVSYMRKRRKTRVPMYRMISLSGEYKDSEYTTQQGKDLLVTLSGLSSLAFRTFVELHQCYSSSTGFSVVVSSNKTNTQKKDFSNGFKELNQADVVKKYKKLTYIINPRMYINPQQYDDLCSLWDSI